MDERFYTPYFFPYSWSFLFFYVSYRQRGWAWNISLSASLCEVSLEKENWEQHATNVIYPSLPKSGLLRDDRVINHSKEIHSSLALLVCEVCRDVSSEIWIAFSANTHFRSDIFVTHFSIVFFMCESYFERISGKKREIRGKSHNETALRNLVGNKNPILFAKIT